MSADEDAVRRTADDPERLVFGPARGDRLRLVLPLIALAVVFAVQGVLLGGGLGVLPWPLVAVLVFLYVVFGGRWRTVPTAEGVSFFHACRIWQWRAESIPWPEVARIEARPFRGTTYPVLVLADGSGRWMRHPSGRPGAKGFDERLALLRARHRAACAEPPEPTAATDLSPRVRRSVTAGAIAVASTAVVLGLVTSGPWLYEDGGYATKAAACDQLPAGVARRLIPDGGPRPLGATDRKCRWSRGAGGPNTEGVLLALRAGTWIELDVEATRRGRAVRAYETVLREGRRRGPVHRLDGLPGDAHTSVRQDPAGVTAEGWARVGGHLAKVSFRAAPATPAARAEAQVAELVRGVAVNLERAG